MFIIGLSLIIAECSKSTMIHGIVQGLCVFVSTIRQTIFSHYKTWRLGQNGPILHILIWRREDNPKINVPKSPYRIVFMTEMEPSFHVDTI